MILNAKIEVFIDFLVIFGCSTHISKANCAKITRDRLAQSAYETYSFKPSFN